MLPARTFNMLFFCPCIKLQQEVSFYCPFFFITYAVSPFPSFPNEEDDRGDVDVDDDNNACD